MCNTELQSKEHGIWGKTFFEKKAFPPNPLSKKLLTLAVSMVKVKSFLVLPFFQKR